MNRDPGPLSPDSIGGASEWSGISRYQGLDEAASPYSAGPSPNPSSRGQLISPPISNGSNIAMNGGYQGPSSNGAQNAPSPPASIARSSIPTSLYAGSTTGSTAGGRERTDNQFEGVLSEHYVALKRFLAAALRDEKANPRPNKARDKLLRLSPVQFQELSTDVFDELLRRQSASRRQPSAGGMNDPGVPAYLLPKDTFHPKRNQARQKLSTLPPPRFRDLATDVFYELERRFPHFATGEMSRNGTPVGGPGGFRPDSRSQPRIRRPSDASSIASYSSRGPRDPNAPQQSPGMPPGSFGREPNNFGRPLPKTFQSNTLVPNKSTMVEDDDDADSFSVRSGPGMGQNGPPATSEVRLDEHWGKRILLTMLQEDKKKLADYEAQLAELKEKVDGLQETLRRKDEELDGKDERVRSIESSAATEKKELQDLRLKLEDQLADAQNLNTQLQSELDRLRSNHADTEHSLRQQLEQLSLSGGTGANGSTEELMQENEQLRRDLREQQELSDDVRVEAQNLLQEMKAIADQKGVSWEQEQALVDQVARLQAEVEEWKNRYSRTKTQLRSVRASSIGLTIQPHMKHDGQHDSPDGLVRDVHVTKFQIAIDELLRIARSEKPAETIEYTKNVIKAVLKITKDIDDSVPGGKLNNQQARLKQRVSNTANNLFIASKNFADAKGLSPVSLLDAAASHITTAVVELVRTVKIRPTPAGEYEDDDETTIAPHPLSNKANDTAKPTPVPQLAVRDSNQSSLYSAATSPHVSQQPSGHSRTPSEAAEHWRERQRSMSGNSGALGLGLGINGNQQHTLIPIRGGGGRESALSATDDIDELKVSGG